MRGAIEDDLVTGLAMHPIGNLIAHGAGRQIDSALLAQEIRHPLAERRHRRIKISLLIAHFGLRHETTHAGTGLGSGITKEINHAETFSVCSTFVFAAQPPLSARSQTAVS